VNPSPYIYPGLPPAARDLEDILLAVCRASGVSKDLIRSRSRHSGIVAARQVYCWHARKTTTRPLKQIAQTAGMTNHATVLHAIRKVDDLLYIGDKLTVTLIEKLHQHENHL
jgi:chromosomal replication initiation ATPase DnaA